MTTSYLDDQHIRAKAVDYVQGKLQHGKRLSAFLLKYKDFLQGALAAVTPISLSTKETSEFDYGHISFKQDSKLRVTAGDISGVGYPKSNANDQLVDLIEKSLGHEKNICLLENSLATPKDPWLKRAHSRIAIYGDEVYHVLTPADRTKNVILEAIREAHAPTVLVGALGRAEAFKGPNTRRFDLREEDLREFAQLSECVFLSAYDSEGYLVWYASIDTHL